MKFLLIQNGHQMQYMLLRSFVDDSNETSNNINSLILVGDFDFTTNEIEINYVDFNYFFVPFDPSLPFLLVDRTIDSNIESGVLYTDGSASHSLKAGDITYWCTCGGHEVGSDDPGGCVSSLDGKTIRCKNDGDCPNACVGTVVEHNYTTVGGGILIKTPVVKSGFIHNFGTGK
ncbi:MAG: hypothetical protein V3V14_10995 [Saprospiraceae bacterium]